MSLRSVTVFVRRLGSAYHASTYQSDSISRASADEAARICAGRFFGVEPQQISLIHQDGNNDQVLIASVRPKPAARRPRPMVAALAVASVTFLVSFALILWFGGAR